jgi:hypothetical protein
MAVSAALVVPGAARLAMDHREARLLNAAHASVMGWEQIAAMLDLSVTETEERYRQLQPRLGAPVAETLPPQPGGTVAASKPTKGRRSASWLPAVGHQPGEVEGEEWEEVSGQRRPWHG